MRTGHTNPHPRAKGSRSSADSAKMSAAAGDRAGDRAAGARPRCGLHVPRGPGQEGLPCLGQRAQRQVLLDGAGPLDDQPPGHPGQAARRQRRGDQPAAATTNTLVPEPSQRFPARLPKIASAAPLLRARRTGRPRSRRRRWSSPRPGRPARSWARERPPRRRWGGRAQVAEDDDGRGSVAVRWEPSADSPAVTVIRIRARSGWPASASTASTPARICPRSGSGSPGPWPRRSAGPGAWSARTARPR